VDSDTASFTETEQLAFRFFDGDTASFVETEHVTVRVSDNDPATFTDVATVNTQYLVFDPPTEDEYGVFGADRLFGRYRLAHGVTVAVKDGAVFELTYPYQEDLEEYDAVYMGGHRHRLTQDEADLLVAAGYGANVNWSSDV